MHIFMNKHETPAITEASNANHSIKKQLHQETLSMKPNWKTCHNNYFAVLKFSLNACPTV